MPGDLVGRASEVDRLFTLARQAFSGHGRAVVIEGEPGVGKSRMLDVLAGHCRDLGARVCRGEAGELDQHVPFGAVGACLGVRAPAGDPDVEQVADLLRREAGGRGGSSAGDRGFTVTEAVVDLIGRWCSATPVALLLDNLQWADKESKMVLHRLGTPLGMAPLLMVTALRPRPRSSELEGLRRSLGTFGAEFIVLDPLPDHAVEQLVSQLAGGRPGPGLMALMRGAAGNPMWINEWLAALRRDHRIVTTAGVADLHVADDPDAAVEESLAGLISQRLEFSSRRAREVIRVAALLGSGFELAELSAVLSAPTIDLWEILAEAVASGLLVDAGERLAFRHDMIRRALAAELPSAVRGALQLQAGRTLAESGAPPRRVAELLLEAKVLDGRAIDWILNSGRTLARHDPAQAILLIRLALRSVDGGDPRTIGLRRHLAWSLLAAGRPEDAARVTQEALASHPGQADVAGWGFLMAVCHFQQGDVELARSGAVRALAGPQVDRPEEIRLKVLLAQCHLHLGDLDAAQQAGMALAGDAPETWARAYGLAAMAGVLLVRGRMGEALGLIDRAVAVAGPKQSHEHWESSLHLIRALTLIDLDRFDEADQALEDGRHGYQQGTAAVSAMWYHRCRAEMRLLNGRWDDVLTEVEVGMAAAGMRGATQTLQGIAALVHLHRGETARITAIDGGTTGPAAWITGWAAALRSDARGDGVAALDLLVEMWARRREAMASHNLHLIWPDIARLALTQDQAERVRPLLPDTARLAERAGASARGVHALCQGVVDANAGQLVSAAAAFAQANRPLAEGYAWECAALLLARKGDVSQANSALDRAKHCYSRLGASWDIERVVASLAALGVRCRPRASSPPRVGWEALTKTERRIAVRVADGLSNPAIAAELFLSPRTVQHHVSSILAKLELTSRVELVAVALGHEDPGGAGR